MPLNNVCLTGITMRMQPLAKLLLLNVMISSSVFAADAGVSVSGTVSVVVPTHDATLNNAAGFSSALSPSKQPSVKTVMLQRLTLSAKAKEHLTQQVTATLNPLTVSAVAEGDSSSPTKMQLGMNKVPVLDQGAHGTCATFAVTGALDAAYGKGDYISQLCHLELGAYLQQQDSTYYSGWDGSWATIVINQIIKYGIVNMSYQKEVGCADVKKYPLNDSNNTGSPYPITDFTAHSEYIMKDIKTNILLDITAAYSDSASQTKLLSDVKTAISNGHRVIFGVALDIYKNNHAGAFGTYKMYNDSWIITTQLEKDLAQTDQDVLAGHEMIITGYDDNAVIIGPDKKQHKGVLTLRNSWGSYAGNEGDFYMSYEYFMTFVDEAHEVISN